MCPTDTSRAHSCANPYESTVFMDGTQEPTPRVLCEDARTPSTRRKILVCHRDSRRRDSDALILQNHGNEVVACDPTLPYSFDTFDRLLSESALVRFDCSAVDTNAFRRLLHVCDYRQRHGMKPFFVCTGVNCNDELKSHLERVLKVDRTVNVSAQGGEEPVLRDRSTSNLQRWGLEIVHRWWVGETICTPGEEVFNVNVFNHGRIESLPLGMKDRVALDGIVRSRVAQTSSQWAASLNASPWVKKHGSRASGALNFRCKFGRNGIKQTIFRLRSLLAAGFALVGVEIDPMRIIEPIRCGREVKYRWNPEIFVAWDHVEC